MTFHFDKGIERLKERLLKKNGQIPEEFYMLEARFARNKKEGSLFGENDPSIRGEFRWASMLRFKKWFIISFEVEEAMIRTLDGIALLAYVRRLKLSKETYDLLTHIRSSPPSRTPGARRGNMPVWYPSKKMHCIIKAESTSVPFA